MPPLELDIVAPVLDDASVLEAVLEAVPPPVPEAVEAALAPPMPPVAVETRVVSVALPQPEINAARAQIIWDECFIGALHSRPRDRSHGGEREAPENDRTPQCQRSCRIARVELTVGPMSRGALTINERLCLNNSRNLFT